MTNKNKKSTTFAPLLQTWRKQYDALYKYIQSSESADKEHYLDVKKRWENNVNRLTKSNTLNTICDRQQFKNQKEKSYFIRDAINVCSQWSDETHTYSLWGVSVLGSAGHLLAASRAGEVYAKWIEKMLDNGSVATSLGGIPLHVAAVFSPQAVRDTLRASVNVFTTDGVDYEKRTQWVASLEPYLFQTHCDLGKMSTSEKQEGNVGSMILTFVVKTPISESLNNIALWDGRVNSTQNTIWNEASRKWATDNDVRLLVTVPEQWSRSVLLGATNFMDFVWGMNAQIDGKIDKVFDISRVFVEFKKDHIGLNAFTEENGFFASVELPKELTMWPLLCVFDALENRNIAVMQTEQKNGIYV